MLSIEYVKKRINLVYSSHLSQEENEAFEKHLNETCGVPVSIFGYPNFNEYSLPEVYNRAISEIDQKDAITVFCHNDIEFDTPNWGKILLKHFNRPNNEYQIIGVAGVESIYSGCWWLDESQKNMNFKEMVGIVNHDNGIRKWESRYSEPHFGVKPVAVIDGLFMAVDIDEIEHEFDERFGKWHFYDMSFVFPNVLDGCNAGVITDIRITHMSIGETDMEWERNKLLFEKLYKNEIPFKIKEYL